MALVANQDPAVLTRQTEFLTTRASIPRATPCLLQGRREFVVMFLSHGARLRSGWQRTWPFSVVAESSQEVSLPTMISMTPFTVEIFTTDFAASSQVGGDLAVGASQLEQLAHKAGLDLAVRGLHIERVAGVSASICPLSVTIFKLPARFST